MEKAEASGRVVQVRRLETKNRIGSLVELFFVALDDDIGAEQQVRKECQLGPDGNVNTLAKLSASNVKTLGLVRGQVQKA